MKSTLTGCIYHNVHDASSGKLVGYSGIQHLEGFHVDGKICTSRYSWGLSKVAIHSFIHRLYLGSHFELASSKAV